MISVILTLFVIEQSGAASIQHITGVATKLIASSHYASNLINLKTSKLDKEWQLFHSILQNRQKILSASCMFHNKADQYLNKVAEWKAQCSSNQLAGSVQEAESLLKKHHELSDEISQIYAEVLLSKNFFPKPIKRKKNSSIFCKILPGLQYQ
jgi:hypothetical protein